MREITLGGRRFPVLFSLNVVERIQKRYGSIEDVALRMMDDASEIKWLVAQVVNEGMRAQHLQFGAAFTPLSEDDIGIMMTMQDMSGETGLIEGLVEAFNDSLGGEKKVTAEQLETVGMTMLQKATNR